LLPTRENRLVCSTSRTSKTSNRKIVLERIEKIFTGIGGTFLVDPKTISAKLNAISAFLFDWDGVFNNGEKNETGSSNFSEVDSMGTNMLRFSYWLQHHKLPFTAIISGERNKASFTFSSREHFTSCYYKVMHKVEALDHFCKEHHLKHDEVAYVFDDVLDISIARSCGLRILVNRKNSPLFTEYIKTYNFADYITGAGSGEFAVRETCELMMGLNGMHDEAISRRSANADVYREYIEARNQVKTLFFTRPADSIIEQNPV